VRVERIDGRAGAASAEMPPPDAKPLGPKPHTTRPHAAKPHAPKAHFAKPSAPKAHFAKPSAPKPHFAKPHAPRPRPGSAPTAGALGGERPYKRSHARPDQFPPKPRHSHPSAAGKHRA
jgi:hypothetical protein